jgi:hypothetical protein
MTGGLIDKTESFGHQEANGGPVSVARIETILVLIKRISLNVGLAVVGVSVEFPGYDVFDCRICGKSAEDDSVSPKQLSVLPAVGINVDTIMNLCSTSIF